MRASASPRFGGPPPPPEAALLGCMLLLYMDEPDAYKALVALGGLHCVGRRPESHGRWRLAAAEAMIRTQLPELHAHLAALGLPTTAWMVR